MDVATRNGTAAGSTTGAAVGISAVVEYDYTAKESDELDLVKGAVIHSIKQMSGGWWEGTLQSNGKTGMFPDNFVRVIDASEDAVTLRDKSTVVNRRCKVIYSYTQVNEDELTLGVGDVIEFLGEVEEGWWRGRLKNKVGVFPSNFVISIEQSPIMASKRPATAALVATATTTTTTTAATTTNVIKNVANSASAASANSAATAAKKNQRPSFHSSKEDLLSSNATTNSNTLANDDLLAPTLPPKPLREYCRVEYPYAPQNEDELELKVGDIITIISMELPDKGWWKGELRGKIGVFPDNFVKLMQPNEVAPLNDLQQSAVRTSKTTNAVGSSAASAANTAATALNISTTGYNANIPVTQTTSSSKVLIRKSGSSSSTHSSNHKDSFGSRDSLNDILSETGLSSGNVAATRKSLENKNLDFKKRDLMQETRNSTTTTTTTVMSASNSSATSELRKSMEILDDKNKSPPPVMSKKPTVPVKKSTVPSVGNIFSFTKKVKSSETNKLTTAASHDYADGIGSSKMSSGNGGLPDAAPSGNVVMRRAATIAVEDSEFDRVERNTMLTDMRAGRVKAPKRRPPSAAVNAIGESNNNSSIYLNGSGGDSSAGSSEMLAIDDGKTQTTHSSDDNSMEQEEQFAKPKPRQWEQNKAPWLVELKASQEKKKTTPSVEPRTMMSERTSKLLLDDAAAKQINSSSSNSHVISSSSINNVVNSSSSSSTTSSTAITTKVQSASISSSSILQQTMSMESSKREYNVNNSSSVVNEAMSKSSSGKMSVDSASSSIDDVRARPNSLSIRNRSTSPSVAAGTAGSAAVVNRISVLKTTDSPAAGNANDGAVSSATAASLISSTAAKPTTTIFNNHHQTTSTSTQHHTSHSHSHQNNASNNLAASSTNSSNSNNSSDAQRVVELEKRVAKLEALVVSQQRTIDDVVRSLREETDRVKVLRGELDKYAQCVTQV